MAYYPRVFYENGDGGGGAAGGGDSNSDRAAASIAESIEQQKNLTEAYSETQKLEARLQVAREEGNEKLASDLENEIRLKRESLGVTQEQLALMDERIRAREQLTEAERLAAEEVEREAQRELELLQQKEEAQAGLLGIASKVIAAAKEQTKELDKQRVALGKTSGLFGQFNQQLTNSVAAAARFGKGTAEVGATIGSLANGMMNFTQMSQANQKTLIDSSLALQQFGVLAEQSAAANDFLMNSLGKSAEEAVGYQKGLIELGAEIGMSGAMLVEKFGSMSGDLAKFGDNAGKVFENLAKTAKATGVEMSELLSVASQFDTFEGAASAVGKLNAQMGTNIDAMALMQEEDPAKQIDMLRDAFLATGKDLSSMSKFEKMAAAEAMGMKLPELQKLLAPKKEATETDKNFDELIEMTTTFGQKLSAVGKQFAVFFTPVISIFVDVLEFIGKGISMFSEFTKKIAENKAIVYTLATVMGSLLLPILAAMAVKTTAATLAMVTGTIAKVKGMVVEYAKMAAEMKSNIVTAYGTAVTIAKTVATGAYSIAVGIATAATTAFGAVLAFITSPIGLVVLGIAGIIAVLYTFRESIGEIGTFFGNMWDGIAEKFNYLIDAIVSGANRASGAVAGLMGSNEEEVPALASGTPSFQGGQAMVGERGPELVNLPRGAEVIPNNKLQQAQKATTAANTAANDKPPVIKLILNERELGQAVMDIIDKKLSVITGIN
jgi:hypothetical protein